MNLSSILVVLLFCQADTVPRKCQEHGAVCTLDGLCCEPLVCHSHGESVNGSLDGHCTAPSTTAYLHVDAVAESLNSGNVCSSDACKLTAERMLDSMNTSVDPCDNFYQYACGKWLAAHPPPSPGYNGTDYDSAFSVLQATVNARVQEMLGSTRASTFKSEVKAKSMFKQCRNQTAERERLGARPLLDLLEQYMGGWPVLTADWNSDGFNLSRTLTELAIYGYAPFFTLDTYEKDSVKYITVARPRPLKPAVLKDNRTRYVERETHRLAAATGLLLRDAGARRTVNDSQIVAQLTRIMALRTELIDMVDGEPVIVDSKRNWPFSRSNFNRSLSNLVTDVFRFVDPSPDITRQRPIRMTESAFFDQLDRKLAQFELLSNEGKRQLANYLGWVLISENLALLSEEYRRVEIDPETPASDPEACASKVSDVMPKAVDAMYVRKHVPRDTKPQITAMVGNLQLGFSDLLSLAQNSWMDNSTAAAAFTKLHAMTVFAAYEDVLVHGINVIDHEYNEMSVGLDYFTTLQEEKKFRNIKALQLINWSLSPASALDYFYRSITAVEAYYHIFANRMYVLAGILNSPFYDSQVPQYLNYGASGFVIGHEITHGFDNSGRHADSAGSLHEWWTNATAAAFQRQEKGLVEQYNGFATPVGPVNGTITLGENIADNGGLKAAYKAYFNHYVTNLNQTEPRLPGFLSFTPEQLFFLSAGQIWCASVSPDQLRTTPFRMDAHSPQEFRVIGPMSNVPEFAAAYNCPPSSRMNPVNKAGVW